MSAGDQVDRDPVAVADCFERATFILQSEDKATAGQQSIYLRACPDQQKSMNSMNGRLPRIAKSSETSRVRYGFSLKTLATGDT